MVQPLHGNKSQFDPVESVAHKSGTSGCNYCHSPFLQGYSQKKRFLFFCFFFQFISLLPLFYFYHRGTEELGSTFIYAFLFFFCITHCWLSNRLVSQSREGDSDLLLAQPQNNKITSLPACSGHGTSIDGDLAPQNCFFVKCCRTERMISPDRITKNKSTNSKQVTPHTLLLRHSRWPPQGCALIQVLPAEVRDGCRSLGVEVWGREKKITTSFPPPPSLKSELCKAIRCPG